MLSCTGNLENEEHLITHGPQKPSPVFSPEYSEADGVSFARSWMVAWLDRGLKAFVIWEQGQVGQPFPGLLRRSHLQ